MRRTLAAVAMSALLVLAGCTAAPGGGDGGGDGGDSGTVQFYVSDQPNAIGDFEHLNVTISKVGFHRANASDDGNASNDGDAGGWTEFDADGQTVDLTRLQGENATLLQQFNLSEGTYTKVFVHVSDVNGTLADGSSAEVKLPSNKLHLNAEFEVASGESVDFVYDISVHRTGNGRYILKPNAGESGTDVPKKPVDRDGKPSDAGPSESRGGNGSARQGELAFYVSDERNAIDDFRHLNVTVSKVGFQRGGESGNWTEFDVDARTVDLTRLKGANATLLQSFDLSAGNYTKVFIHVSEVNGTLTDGSHPDVKLPSSKLQLNKRFAVAPNATTEFVYDVTVVKRGKSGSYNLKPVASESGTDVPVEKVDESGGDDGSEGESETESDAASLDATFAGNVTRGENATVSVTRNGSAVEGATVAVEQLDGELTTGANGTATFRVPENVSELTVTVTYEGAEVELERTFDDERAADSGGDGSGDGGQQALARPA